MEIVQAQREAIPALIALWGPSGSGKTYTALHIARGLVGDTGKIVVIDTENKRAKFYSEKAGGWFHLDLQPPFTPRRYHEAFLAAENFGADCIIVDSMSHVWEGEGGVLEMADNQRTRDGRFLDGLAKWKTPKTEYKKLINALLRGKSHVIFCLRAKEHSEQVGKGKDAKIIKDGLTPICGKNFVYEMTVSALLGPDHKPVFPGDNGPFRSNPMTPSVKFPEGLEDVFKQGKYIGIDSGEAIRSWLSGGVEVDHDAEEVMRTAREVAQLGSEALTTHGESSDETTKGIMRKHWAELKEIAQCADAEREAIQSENEGDYFDE